jgi:hypothetical protein
MPVATATSSCVPAGFCNFTVPGPVSIMRAVCSSEISSWSLGSSIARSRRPVNSALAKRFAPAEENTNSLVRIPRRAKRRGTPALVRRGSGDIAARRQRGRSSTTARRTLHRQGTGPTGSHRGCREPGRRESPLYVRDSCQRHARSPPVVGVTISRNFSDFSVLRSATSVRRWASRES